MLEKREGRGRGGAAAGWGVLPETSLGLVFMALQSRAQMSKHIVFSFAAILIPLHCSR